MHKEAFKRIGHLYPLVDLETGKPIQQVVRSQSNTATIIAWIWARTVKSPNPMFSHVYVPLSSTFILSSKNGKECYVEPILEGDTYRFEVRNGKPPESAKNGTKAEGHGANFYCILSGTLITGDFIKAEGKKGEIHSSLMAIVVEGKRGRIYLSPTKEHELIAGKVEPIWRPEIDFFQQALGFRIGNYGLKSWSDLFSKRQLLCLSTFSDLLNEVRTQIKSDAILAGMANDGKGLDYGGNGAEAYAEAVTVYLAFALDKMADLGNSFVRWEPVAQCPRQLFGRQAIPMIWGFAEANPFSNSSGGWDVFIDGVVKAFSKAFGNIKIDLKGSAEQADAQTQKLSINKVISTDPPYYDNIGYADLSDFFYVWLRRSLRTVYPNLFSTMVVPKTEELVATPRHGNREEAEVFFLDGMSKAMYQLSQQAHPAFPTTIYYAFKQSNTTDKGTGNTGWETFLEAVLNAGFTITGTWPMRTENGSRMRGQGSNALASSIALVCRKLNADAPSISRREFIKELKQELRGAIETMIGGEEGLSPIAPVDLAQAVIGPGMAVFSKYSAVLEADGNPMTVHDALILINREITVGDDFDEDTQFSLSWFDEQGWSDGEFGKADVLARAKGTSVDGVAEAGVVESGGGKVRLLKWAQYPTDWSPDNDYRKPIWEALHHLVRVLNQQGESSAGSLLSRMPERSESMRQLAYRLYTLCERKGWAEDARAYNELISAWPEIQAAATEKGHKGEQLGLDMFT